MPPKPAVRWDPTRNAWRLRFKSKIPLLNKDGTPRLDKHGRPKFKTRHHLGSGKKNYIRALGRAAAIMGVQEPGARGGGPAPETVAEAVEQWLLVYGNEWHHGLLRDWCVWAGAEPLTTLDADHLFAYLRHLDQTPTRQQRRHVKQSARTVQAKVNVAWRVLRWAQKKKYLPAVPEKPVVRQDEHEPRDIPPELLAVLFASNEELKRLYPGGPPFRALYKTGAAILRFIVETGCRPGEACNLRWKELDHWGTATQERHKTKRSTGRNRRIPLTSTAREIVERQPRTGEFVFINQRGKPYKPTGLRSIMRRRIASLGLSVSPVYALRHSRAQSILEAGYRLEDVAAFLGHKRLTTAERYAQVRADRVRELADNLVSPVRPMPAAGSKPVNGSAPPPGRTGRRRSVS